jgi:AraC family transcriptional regulator, transcriptional activator of pobA
MRQSKRRQVLHFAEINQAYAAMGFHGRTDLPGFYICTMEETYPSTRQVMPPYTLRFYCVLLLENSHDAVLEINTERQSAISDTVSFQAPGHVSAWVRGAAQRGFLLYFQPEFLSHHPTPCHT